ncbi:hypothetical protein C8J57DRAFT_1239905 [Mycena rebaudengoi]|nr:hypothetical protein C8J57DRAFT_1239905 [Mycena rebaudengoi]
MNWHTLSVHLKYAAVHLSSSQDSEDDIGDRQEELPQDSKDIIEQDQSSLDISEDDSDFWSQESDETSDFGNELESDQESDDNNPTVLVIEARPEYYDFLFENLVISSENPSLLDCALNVCHIKPGSSKSRVAVVGI